MAKAKITTETEYTHRCTKCGGKLVDAVNCPECDQVCPDCGEELTYFCPSCDCDWEELLCPECHVCDGCRRDED